MRQIITDFQLNQNTIVLFSCLKRILNVLNVCLKQVFTEGVQSLSQDLKSLHARDNWGRQWTLRRVYL